jgi:hypothetical protein
VALKSTFALDLAKFREQAGDNARQVVRKVSIDLLTKIVLRTPVGNPSLWKSKPPAGYVGGRLRANWAVTFQFPSTVTTTATDKHGQNTIVKGRNTINRSYGDHPIFITNSLPYAIPVEYGHSGVQAPQGMVRITVTEFQTMVDNAVRSLPK